VACWRAAEANGTNGLIWMNIGADAMVRPCTVSTR